MSGTEGRGDMARAMHVAALADDAWAEAEQAVLAAADALIRRDDDDRPPVHRGLHQLAVAVRRWRAAVEERRVASRAADAWSDEEVVAAVYRRPIDPPRGD